MTALKLDERQPLVVIVGAFNPAIFSPLWIAKYLHGFADGVEVPMMETMVDGPGGVAQFTFIEGVALVVSPQRLEAFVLSHEPLRLEALERTLLNLVVALPHTPLSGIGCNLQYFDEDPSGDLVSLFDSPEGLEGEYPIRSRTFITQMEHDGGVLNLSRVNASAKVQFNFNYHHSENDSETYAKIIPGMIARAREHSARLLKSLYGLGDHEAISFMRIAAEEKSNGEIAN